MSTYFRLSSNNLAMVGVVDTDRRRRKFQSRIRPVDRWPRCPRTWRCWWCFGARHSGLCNPASTRRGTTSGRASQRPARASFRSAIGPRTNSHCNINNNIKLIHFLKHALMVRNTFSED